MAWSKGTRIKKVQPVLYENYNWTFHVSTLAKLFLWKKLESVVHASGDPHTVGTPLVVLWFRNIFIDWLISPFRQQQNPENVR